MGQSDYLREGDFNRICDQCGRKRKASDTRKQWDGLIVCADGDCFDARHPLDFVRGRRDKQTVPDPRPDSAPVFTTGDVYVDDSYAEYVDDSGIQQYVSD